MVFNADIRNNFIQYGQSLQSLNLITGSLSGQTELLAKSVQNLTPKQQALALATKGVSQAQIAEVLAVNQVEKEQTQQILLDTAIIQKKKQLTKEYALEAITAQGLSATKADEIMTSAGIVVGDNAEVISKKKVNVATLEAKLAQEGLSATQIKAITTQLGLGTSTVALSNYFKGLAASTWDSVKAFGAFLVTTPAGWATIAVTAISAVVLGINAYNKKQEEAIQNAKDMADKTSSQISEMDKLVSEYEAIIDSEKSEAEKTEELNEWKRELVKTYDLEKEKLEEINLEREKGIELLKNEIDESKKNKYNKYLDEYQEQIEDANEKFGQEYTLQIHLGSQLSTDDNISGQKYWYGVDEKLQEMFDDITLQESQFFMGMENIATISFDDSIDQLNELTKIYEYLLDLQSKRQFNGYDLTEDEKLIFNAVKQKIDEVNDRNKNGELDIYKEASKAQAYVDFLNYVAVNSAENVGKDTFKAWTEGLLNQAENAEQKRNLEELIVNQFPDLTKYFNNLDKAYDMFGIDDVINDANEGMKKAFINGLSNEDLEVATKIPDLFADGLEGATKKIEAWKKQNPIEAEVKITIDEALEGQTNKIKAITSAMEEMADTGYITSETYAELAKLGGNFTDCLEWENGKLKLNVDKLKDLEIQQLATAKSANALAISELELKAASLASHGQDFSDIQAQIEALMKENAVYTQLMEEIANAKPDEGSSTSEEPKSVTQFKKALAEKEHLLNTNQISEQDYYEWLDSESKRVYGNLADYEEDLWKYEEQVYKWRKEQEQDLFDKKIENYKKLSDNALDKYVDGNGNELTVNASFDYAREQIYSAIAETQNRINELSLKTGFEDEIEELTSDLEDLYDTLEDINKQEIESQKEYIETLKDEYSDLMDEQIDQQKKLSEEIEKSYESRISAIDKQIDAIEKVNEIEERQNDILEARQALEKASVKNRLVYTGNGRWEAKRDEEAYQKAQKDYDEAIREEQIAKLEEQKELLETQRDNSKEYYDKAIEDLESQKEAREKQYDILVDIYEQLGGEKKQTSLNESLIEKLTTNGDINKAVQNLTPSELKQAIESGVLTVDKDGNYSIDYEKILNKSSDDIEKIKNDTSKLTEILSGDIPETTENSNSSKTTKSTGENSKTTKLFDGYNNIKDILRDIFNGKISIQGFANIANTMMDNNIQRTIQKDISASSYFVNNNNNVSPTFNITNNFEGNPDDNAVNRFTNKLEQELSVYTQKLTSEFSKAITNQRYSRN